MLCALSVAAPLAAQQVDEEATIQDRIADSDSDREAPLVTKTTDESAGADPEPSPRQQPPQGSTIAVEVVPDAAEAQPSDEARSDEQPETEPRESPALDLTAREVPLSGLMGLPVRGADGNEMGEVEDVIVSLETGAMVSLVVGSGGLLGIGGSTERIAIERVAIDALGEAVIVSASSSKGD